MEIPPFKFNNYKVEELKLNNRYIHFEDSSIQFDVNGVFDQNGRLFYVNLFFRESFNPTDESELDENYRIYLELSGEFEFKDNVSIDNIPDFFWANSIAIMYPYLRSFVSLVTMQSSDHTLILPLLNLSSLGPKLKENTIIK